MVKFWTKEEVFSNGDQYFDRMLADIDQARSEIFIEIYIFNDDELGTKIAAHLLEASKRGVKIEVIIDGLGSYTFYHRLGPLFETAGIQVKMYNPLPFYHPYYGDITYKKKWNMFANRLMRLNIRDHRKIVIIDSRILFTGSFNITSEPTRFHGTNPWKDMGARVEGAHVKFAVLNFKKIWKLREYSRYKKLLKGTVLPNWRHSPLRLNNTLYMKRHFYKSFIKKINAAEENVWLMTPYFIPTRRMIQAMGKAARRGVDVRILLSSNPDVNVFKWLQYFYHSYLINKGVKIYHYSFSILHAKNYIIDDWITVGSSNLNHRSFLHDLEVDLVIQERENIQILKNHFCELTPPEKQITEEIIKHWPFWDRIISRLFFLFKYWF
ncbi:MAG TPA: phosphatidylserine/phosphatidylglycerophosphate/cardiolipin synthase family protein [Bacteriovoracaceae bacterium]|nr:phosphatidylserine/phosphatidylglycerophosphate/cardiolipin synthase family protein [Bacteriovoracaceae bacterium]